MDVLTIASGKGGVGKTTLVTNLGVALAQAGKEVILVDTDIEMGNLVLHLGLEGLEPTLQDVLAGEVKVEDAIFKGPGGIKVLPAGIALEGLMKVEPDMIKKVVKELENHSDLVILDAAAGLGLSVIPSLSSGDVISVVNPEITSISGAIKIKMAARDAGSTVLGVILNRVTNDIGEVGLEEIEEALGSRVLASIPDDKEMRRSTMFGSPLMIRCPEAPASIAIKNLALELLDYPNGD